MRTLGDRLSVAIAAHRGRGEKPTRIHMGPNAAARLAEEDDPNSICRPDGSIAGFDGVRIWVIPNFTSVTVSAEKPGQQGRTSTAVSLGE